MIAAIGNTPRDYAWGSTTAIAELLGTEPTGQPEAELWLGAHAGSPSRILHPEQVGGARDLSEWIGAAPEQVLGGRDRLPFLMKVLAASAPLSLQVHPSARQARDGYERENRLGIPLDAPHRNYRDPHPKPEIIYALSDTFDALCGFRPVEEARRVLVALGLDEMVARLDDLPGLMAWLLNGGPHVDALVVRVTAQAAAAAPAVSSLTAQNSAAPTPPAPVAPSAPVTSPAPVAFTKTKENAARRDHSGPKRYESDRDSFVLDALAVARVLAEAHPGDAGIVCSLLLNHVTLTQGEALYLPAGNIHAYLQGVGIEVMTESDNVLRGGLSVKHVDVPELLRVLDFTPRPLRRLTPDAVSANLAEFRPAAADGFVLIHVTGDAQHPLNGPAIALCTAGKFAVDGAESTCTLEQGAAAFITPDESPLSIVGSGDLFLVATP